MSLASDPRTPERAHPLPSDSRICQHADVVTLSATIARNHARGGRRHPLKDPRSTGVVRAFMR